MANAEVSYIMGFGQNAYTQGIWNTLNQIRHPNELYRSYTPYKTQTSGEPVVGLFTKIQEAEKRFSSSSILKAVSKLQARKEEVEEDKKDKLDDDDPVKACGKQATGQSFPLPKETELEEPSSLQLDDDADDEQEYSDDPVPEEYRPDLASAREEYEEKYEKEYHDEWHNKEKYYLEEEEYENESYEMLSELLERSEANHSSPPPHSEQTMRIVPLTVHALFEHTESYEIEDPLVIPPGPYEFYTNPYHLPADRHGTPIGCPDGCLDDEVWLSGVFRSKRTVDTWFDRHFTLQDARAAMTQTLLFEQFAGDREDKWQVEEPVMFGATEFMEFPSLKRLYKFAGELEAEENSTPADRVKRNMRQGEWEEWLYLPYYHGQNYDNILAEYEPRCIPSNNWWSYDQKMPIWEARGLVLPGQEDLSWWEQTLMEYKRQWRMYRVQDEAKMLYAAEIGDYARWQYYQAGLLPRISSNGRLEL